MKNLVKLTLGLLIAYFIIRLLVKYLRPVCAPEELASSPLPRAEPPPLSPSPPLEQTLEPQLVNLNQADVTTLIALPGIGPALAERIIAHRRRGGPYTRLDDLTQVRGIGPALVERLRPWVQLD